MPISDKERDELCRIAIDAMSRAYAPYSKYAVGAALLAESGKTYAGCNVENASYGLAMCAERIAVGRAASEGERKLRAACVATSDGGSPCGACRQVLAEFADGALQVFLVNREGELLGQFTLDELLPHRFTLESHP